jgi:hypothetical protein
MPPRLTVHEACPEIRAVQNLQRSSFTRDGVFMVLSAADMRSRVVRVVTFVTVAFVTIALVPVSASAQTVTDERIWLGLIVQERSGTASPWRWTVESLLRTRDGAGTLDVIGLRPILGYDLTDRSTVSAGYAWSPSFPAAGGTSIEQRLFEQYIWSGRLQRYAVSSRSRLEQRFIEGNSGVLVRFRQQVRVSRPIRAGSRLSISVYDEFFVHLNDTTRAPRGIDQNRIFGGLGVAFSGAARLEAGYLNQFSPGHGRAARMNHVLSAVMTFGL